jgi:hypothetical protein
MKTDDLIRALAADATDKVVTPLGRTLVLALLPALAVCAAFYFAMMGPRSHLLALVSEPRILFKLAFPLALVVCAGSMLLRLVRPASDLRFYIAALVFLALALVAAVVSELVVVPEQLWMTRAVGHNAALCLRAIPMLSAAPFLAIFIVTRRGAPTHPALAGAGVGLFAAAIGATIYATHCPDDSPLFVATWYVLAIAGVTAVGAVAGSRLLRW